MKSKTLRRDFEPKTEIELDQIEELDNTIQNRVSKRSPQKTLPTAEAFDTPALCITNQIIRAAIDQKALDVCALDLVGVSDIADYFVIASGTSERHVHGIAEKIRRQLQDSGEKPISVCGLDHPEWVVLDYGNVVVHVFYEPKRQFYDLEQLWNSAERLALDPELEAEARHLRTGMHR